MSSDTLDFILGEDDHNDDDHARWSTFVSCRTMLLLAEFPLFLWLRRSSMIIIFMDIAIMVVMIVAECKMSLLSTHFHFVNSHLGSTAPPTDTTSSPFLTSDTLGANIEK